MITAEALRRTAAAVPRARNIDLGLLAPHAVAAAAFAILFWVPLTTLARDWWHDADAGHGLLLAPLALYLAWKRGVAPAAQAQPLLGVVVLTGAVFLRYGAGLMAELFTLRMSMMIALAGLVVFQFGARQLLRWWLPVALLLLSVPLPSVIVGTLALPLQLQASQIGAALLDMRGVPVLLEGNVLHIPGHALFVTEACSGLRSLSALLSLGVLIGGLWLRYPAARLLLLALTLPVAVLLNGVRVFLTAFLMHFVSPSIGEGFMHLTEGWIIFIIAFLTLGGLAWLLLRGESWIARRRAA